MHTPGPWEVGYGYEEVFDLEIGIAIYKAGAHDAAPLAAVSDLAPNAEADAHLIAAAPELLEALELLQATHKHEGPCVGRQCDAMNAAIAKARGIATAPPAEAEGASR